MNKTDCVQQRQRGNWSTLVERIFGFFPPLPDKLTQDSTAVSNHNAVGLFAIKRLIYEVREEGELEGKKRAEQRFSILVSFLIMLAFDVYSTVYEQM